MCVFIFGSNSTQEIIILSTFLLLFLLNQSIKIFLEGKIKKNEDSLWGIKKERNR